MIRVNKGRGRGHYSCIVCSRAHARAGCEYQALRYDHVEETLRDNAVAIVNQAPRGEQATAIEEDIFSLSEDMDDLLSEADALASELVATKSQTIRDRLNGIERKLSEKQNELRELKELRDRTASAFVIRRLEAVRDALLAEPLDVQWTNRVLREAVEKIVIKPTSGNLDVVWRHGGASENVPVFSRHRQWL